MATSHDVIKYFREKTSVGYKPVTYIGAEQRFVSPIRNSNINNLEEQFLIGTDSYSETYVDSNGNTIIVESFYTNPKEEKKHTGYYRLETIIYNSYKDKSIYAEGNKLKIILSNKENLPSSPTTYEIIRVDKLYFVSGPYSGQSLMFDGSTVDTIEDELRDLKGDGSMAYDDAFKALLIEYGALAERTTTLVLTKTTSRKYSSDGRNEIICEEITNHMKEEE